ncbi:MAG: hypothetical protein HUJ68_07605 [Clostridia bacterium]|nr:hypothetical protein [Clostridia bacterium]
MLKIKEIKYEIENKGPANGHPEISIYFEEDEAVYHIDEEGRYSLYKDFKDQLAKMPVDVNDAYHRACDGSQETFFKFNGSEIIKDENFEQFQEFAEEISKDSLEIQKALLAEGKLKFQGLKPPYYLWEGIPEVITNKSAYELFNNPYAIIKNTDTINQLALVQVLQHDHGHVYADWVGNGKDADFINNLRNTFKFYKVVIISKPSLRKEAEEFCLKNGYVTYTYFTEEK